MAKISQIAFDLKNMVTLTESMLSELSYFKASEKESGPINAAFDAGNEKFVLVTGENASGKSFVRRLYYAVLKEEKFEVIHLSQQGRSSSGIVSSLIYGDESYNSTGYLTSRLISTGIKTCQGRETAHYIIWDEPDIGLSESYAGGVGVAIRKFVENLPELTLGVVVITHSKALVRQLLPVKPSHLRLGGCPDLMTWLSTTSEPVGLESLYNRNNTMYDEIQKILKEKN
jgi:hypothetical protein